ncbi:16549_t:CDS:2 [Dentiscutata erythropus]|uniref:16549_t:CDS:1 n=1 Tax=Dentiscutata erythropus TaxID=1348616 RepID=A0A9N8ZR45_9GLOM|nr:16549_t:CDS:2 [Dentiscutata erythropus]
MKQLNFAASIFFGVFLLTISVLSVSVIYDCTYEKDPCKIDLTIKDHKCEHDGCGEQPVVVVYDTNSKMPNCSEFPAPTIYVRPRQRIQVLVRNELNEMTTIHWHGLHMRNTPFSDGVPAITQCPIQPGKSFLYDFYANDEPGTHWYHSHYKTQRMAGFYGLFIINETDTSYKDYTEHNIIISDLYHENTQILLDNYQYTTSDSPYGKVAKYEPIPHSILINGQGKGNCKKNCNRTEHCEENCTGTSEVNCLESCEKICYTSADTGIVYDLSKGDKHRFRIINAGALMEYHFSIDNHTLQIIEVEGQYVEYVNKSESVHHLPIHLAQRYSVIATRDKTAQNITKFWMRIQTRTDCLRGYTPCCQKQRVVSNILATVRYDSSGGKPDTIQDRWIDNSNLRRCGGFNLSMLAPKNLSSLPPSTVNKTFNLNVFMLADTDYIDSGVYSLTTVGEAYEGNNPKKYIAYDDFHNTLDSVYAGVSSWPSTQNIITLDTRDQLIEVIIRNFDDISHPFHLHGHVFWVMKVSDSRVTETFKYPIMRDTTTIPGNGCAVIRFVANNPGVWAFHCHVEWHLEVGMLVQFLELPEEIKFLRKPTPAPWALEANPDIKYWDNLCSTQ